MYKVTLLYPRDIEDEVLIELGNLGILEVVPLKEGDFPGFKKEIPENIHKINLFIDTIERTAQEHTVPLDEYLPLVKRKVEKRLYTLNELYSEYDALSAFFSIPSEISKLEKQREFFSILFSLTKKDPRTLNIYSNTDCKLIKIPPTNANIVEDIFRSLNIEFASARIHNEYYILFSTSDTEITGFLLGTLRNYHIEDIEIIKTNENIKDVSSLRTIIEKINSDIKKLRNEYASRIKEYSLKLTALYYKALVTNKILIIKTHTLKGNYTAILRGWTPKDSLDSLKTRISEKFSNRVIISVEEATEHEEPPRQIKMPKTLWVWGSLLGQMGYPTNEDIFPWWIAGLLWTFMFGFMFPDIGQGLTLILMGLLFSKIKSIRKKIEGLLGFPGQKLGALFISAGVFATIFGVLFGEFFLVEIYHPIMPGVEPHWVTASGSIKWVIKYSIVIGITELFLAILLYMIRNIKNGHYSEIIFGEWGLPGLMMFIGLVTMGLYFIGIKALLPPIRIGDTRIIIGFEQKGMAVISNLTNPKDSWPTYLFLGGMLLFLLGGFVEGNLGDRGASLIELPLTIVSNTLSFTRLAGFLIGHAAFGLMVETFAEIGGSMGFWGGLIAMNLLVMTLEVLVVSLQSLRLLLYEFATKWYIGGGQLFRPFRL